MAALQRAELDVTDVDVFTVHEGYASVGLAWLEAVGADPERVNPNGSPLAVGHPIGATGVWLLASLLDELERTGGRWGVAASGATGGVGQAVVIERVG
jgi:acetyl-CoA C-acetyltransferase